MVPIFFFLSVNYSLLLIFYMYKKNISSREHIISFYVTYIRWVIKIKFTQNDKM